eukprot:scaffold5083_cov334-Prasinococcus_capsulatus_cf.AAC.1
MRSSGDYRPAAGIRGCGGEDDAHVRGPRACCWRADRDVGKGGGWRTPGAASLESARASCAKIYARRALSSTRAVDGCIQRAIAARADERRLASLHVAVLVHTEAVPVQLVHDEGGGAAGADEVGAEAEGIGLGGAGAGVVDVGRVQHLHGEAEHPRAQHPVLRGVAPDGRARALQRAEVARDVLRDDPPGAVGEGHHLVARVLGVLQVVRVVEEERVEVLLVRADVHVPQDAPHQDALARQRGHPRLDEVVHAEVGVVADARQVLHARTHARATGGEPAPRASSQPIRQQGHPSPGGLPQGGTRPRSVAAAYLEAVGARGPLDAQQHLHGGAALPEHALLALRPVLLVVDVEHQHVLRVLLQLAPQRAAGLVLPVEVVAARPARAHHELEHHAVAHLPRQPRQRGGPLAPQRLAPRAHRRLDAHRRRQHHQQRLLQLRRRARRGHQRQLQREQRRGLRRLVQVRQRGGVVARRRLLRAHLRLRLRLLRRLVCGGAAALALLLLVLEAGELEGAQARVAVGQLAVLLGQARGEALQVPLQRLYQLRQPPVLRVGHLHLAHVVARHRPPRARGRRRAAAAQAEPVRADAQEVQQQHAPQQRRAAVVGHHRPAAGARAHKQVSRALPRGGGGGGRR